MSPEEFVGKWRGTTRTERSAAQEHFLDLCALLEVPKPADVDRHGTEYTFEKSTRKIGDTAGFADVWKRHCFAWEYKGKRSNLVQAYAQLKQYAGTISIEAFRSAAAADLTTSNRALRRAAHG